MSFATEELLTKKQVSEILKISTRSLDRLIEKGDFPRGLKLGGVPRWKRSTVEEAIDMLDQPADKWEGGDA